MQTLYKKACFESAKTSLWSLLIPCVLRSCRVFKSCEELVCLYYKSNVCCVNNVLFRCLRICIVIYYDAQNDYNYDPHYCYCSYQYKVDITTINIVVLIVVLKKITMIILSSSKLSYLNIHLYYHYYNHYHSRS